MQTLEFLLVVIGFPLIPTLLGIVVADLARRGVIVVPEFLRRIAHFAYEWLAWLPAAFLLTFTSLVARAALFAHGWPRESEMSRTEFLSLMPPVPDYHWASIHIDVAAWLAIAAFPSIIIFAAIFPLEFVERRRIALARLRVYAAGYALMWAVLLADPGHVVAWFVSVSNLR